MGIGSRLKETTRGAPVRSAAMTAEPEPGQRQLNDPLVALKQKAHGALFDRLGARLYDPSLSSEALRRLVRTELEELLRSEMSRLSIEERTALVAEISEDLLGMGPIESFLDDPEVTEVMVNGDDAIFVERGGRLYLSDARFVSQEHLLQVIQRIVTSVGRRVDQGSPMVDARLPDGSRVNAVIPPLALDGPMLTIRKFSKSMLALDDLVTSGSINRDGAEFMKACVARKKSILISGGTGSGKTTMLNALSAFIPDGERIITIEDAAELQLEQRHTIRLESRPANVEGVGEVSIRDLVRNSLRMRPDRIIVGEVRGAEALDMLQAMNTGHAGSLSTVHANSPRDALSRIETMVLSAGIDLPLRAIREQVSSAIDLVIQIGRMADGKRGVLSITEIDGMEGETTTMSDLFELVRSESGDFMLQPTGIRSSFDDELRFDVVTDESDGYSAERKTFW